MSARQLIFALSTFQHLSEAIEDRLLQSLFNLFGTCLFLRKLDASSVVHRGPCRYMRVLSATRCLVISYFRRPLLGASKFVLLHWKGGGVRPCIPIFAFCAVDFCIFFCEIVRSRLGMSGFHEGID